MSFHVIKVDLIRSVHYYVICSFIPILWLCGVRRFYEDLWENAPVSKWRRVVRGDRVNWVVH